MAEQVNIEVIGYNKTELNRTINTQFTQFGPVTTTEPATDPASTLTIDEFFTAYSNLFYTIPKYGETNSHEYLVKTSSEYIGGEAINEEVIALQNEITQLRQENLELQQNILNLQTPA
jgi:hypothetical protein